MKGSVIALFTYQGRNGAAHLVNGQLHDLLLDGDGPMPGAIFRAICDRPIKGAGGIFVKLPDGQRGYLRHGKGLVAGQSVLVQATGHAEPGKAIPLTNKIIFKSRYAIATPGAPGRNVSRSIRDEEEIVRLKELAHDADIPEGMGLIIRSLAEGAQDDAVASDIALVCELARSVAEDTGDGPETLVEGRDAQAMAWTEWPAPDVYDDSQAVFENHQIADHIDAVLTPSFSIADAQYFIEPTRALVAVDVNTGKDGSLAAGLKANIALARDLPRQLRCRGLGGQITLDLAPMAKKERRGFEQVLRRAFKQDSIDTALAGWTPLGHYELQRKRERLPIAEVLSAP